MPWKKTVLEVRVVGPQARARYEKALERFMKYARQSNISATTIPEKGRAGAEHLEAEFLKGEPVEVANYLLAALKNKHPPPRRGGTACFPRIEASVKGWRRLQPARARLPIPKQAIALVCHRLVLNGRRTRWRPI